MAFSEMLGGFSKGSFVLPTGESFAFVVDLKAAMFAIRIASERGWSNVWLESDSTFVVKLFKVRPSKVSWCCRIEWTTCICLLEHMSLVVSHIYGERNKVADVLANYGARQSCFLWWPSYLDFCNRLVYDDFSSKESYRFV